MSWMLISVMEAVQAQLKEVGYATAAEAAASALRVREGEEAQRLEGTCREIIEHFSNREGSVADREELLAGFLKSRSGKQDSET